MKVITIRTVLLAICLGLMIALVPAGLTAKQADPHTVEFWGGMAGWSGEDASGFKAGPGTGSTLLFNLGMPVDIGLDAAFYRMDSDQVVKEIGEFAICATARYRFRSVPRLTPFIGVQSGYTRLSGEYLIFRLEQNGWLAGGNAGLEVPMGSRVMLSAAAGASYYTYYDTKIFLYDAEVPSSGGSAWRYWVRLGLTFRWWR